MYNDVICNKNAKEAYRLQTLMPPFSIIWWSLNNINQVKVEVSLFN